VIDTKNGNYGNQSSRTPDHNQASLETVICSDTKADTSATLVEVLVLFGKPMAIEIRRLEANRVVV
jgi:hypothetical protein